MSTLLFVTNLAGPNAWVAPSPNLPPIDCVAGPSLQRSEAQTGDVPVARGRRNLAANVAADVVAYSRLMGRDESGTLACLREHRKKRLEPALARYGGRLEGQAAELLLQQAGWVVAPSIRHSDAGP